MSSEYTETLALVAVMDGDLDGAVELLDSLNRFERREFAENAARLDSLAGSACDTCGKTIRDWRDLVSSGPVGFGPRVQWHRTCGRPTP